MKQVALLSAVLLIISPLYVQAVPGTMMVDLEGTMVDVNYDATSLTVNSIDVDLDFISLIIDVDVTGSLGILEITLERSFFDSIFEGSDDAFIIIADGDEPNFEETETTLTSRTLRIELPNGTDEIEIIGTVFGDLSTTEPPVEEPEPPVEEPEPPVEEPEPPVEEPEPPVEEPEPPVEEPEDTTQQKTSCGPGTVLKDGVCVLDEICGAGTILQDGVCVLAPSDQSSRGMGFELVYAAIAAFIIAFAVIIILYIIGRGSR